ncbi:MAG: hypothetical protein M1833_001642 [Piccolia ochrophora]|nr:MAG: hypothetical protein M1833_001642 [Piccolia ochrophora]
MRRLLLLLASGLAQGLVTYPESPSNATLGCDAAQQAILRTAFVNAQELSTLALESTDSELWETYFGQSSAEVVHAVFRTILSYKFPGPSPIKCHSEWAPGMCGVNNTVITYHDNKTSMFVCPRYFRDFQPKVCGTPDADKKNWLQDQGTLMVHELAHNIRPFGVQILDGTLYGTFEGEKIAGSGSCYDFKCITELVIKARNYPPTARLTQWLAEAYAKYALAIRTSQRPCREGAPDLSAGTVY